MSKATERMTERLLAELDPLPYPERIRALARHGKALARDAQLAAVVDELRRRGAYERSLALTMALVARQSDAVVAAIDDPDRRISAYATKACLRSGWLSPPALADLVVDMPADSRRAVYRWVRALRQYEHADALVDAVRARFGAVEAARLLPACGPATVARLLPELEHAVGNWDALGSRHPETTIDHATGTLSRLTPAARAAWWQRCGAGVLAAAPKLPHRVLEVLEQYAPATYLPGQLATYGVLAAADPGRVLGLLTAPARAPWLLRNRLPAAVLGRLARLTPSELLVLGERLRGSDGAFTRLLDAMPPGRRGEFYDAVTADVDTGQRVLNDWILDVLPHAWREREARRILGLARVQEDEAATLRYTAYLPWAEAAPVLEAATRRAEADDRAVAYELLIGAARRSRDPATVAGVVDKLSRLRNEQDPVRARALLALARAARLLRPSSLEALAGIVADTRAARDASPASLSALRVLAVSVVQHHHADPALLRWALHTFEQLFVGHRLPLLGRLDKTLRRGQEHELFAAVRSWIEAGMARGQFDPLFRVTGALGRRAWWLPDLQDLLRKAIRPGVASAVLTQAVKLWLADPSSRAERVAEVLRTDSSTVTIARVWQTLCARRTDLLDTVLLGRGPKGKLLTSGVRWVPGYATHLHRWLPRQQHAHAALQEQVVADDRATLHRRVAAVAAAARVPGHGWSILERYRDSTNVNLAEAAIAGLARTDRPADALPILLSYADRDRARVAVYAASRAARFVPPARLANMLAGIASGSGKVTSRKEAVRLLASLGPPEAMELVVDAWRQEGQHRDVRAAIVSAATRRLERAASWQILAEAAAGSREEQLAMLAARPATVAESDRPRDAELVVRACGSGERVVSRAAWASLPGWALWAPDLTDTVTAAASDLDDHRGWFGIAGAVASLLDHRPVLDAALAELVRLDAADEEPGGPARDRPAGRRIAVLVGRVTDWADRAGPDADREPVREAARSLAGQPGFVPQAAHLLTHLVRLDAATPSELVADLTEIAQLAADRPVLAGSLADELARAMGRRKGTWRASTIRSAASTLAGRSDLASGLLAVALAGAGAGQGWTPPWQDLVHQLRRHAAADVRADAFDLDMSAA